MKKYLVLACLMVFAAPALAQPKPPAMPVVKVAKEELAAPVSATAPVVAELFTAKSCAFCPQADQVFAALAAQPGVIALACHVDYVPGADPLAQPFCKDRQGWYMDRLRAGPSYTPQLVVNGAAESVGYKTDLVTAQVKAGRAQAILPIGIQPPPQQAGTKSIYLITLPNGYSGPALNGWQLAVATFKKPAPLTAAEAAPIVRAADNLQVMKLDGFKGPAFRLTVPMTPDDQGFVVILQRQDTGRIAAAGQLLR